jgi:hypothetical protein
MESQIVELVSRYPKVYEALIPEAEKDKVEWTKRFNDPEWMKSASKVSTDAAKAYASKDVEQIAKEALWYLHYRAHGKQGYRYIDPLAREKWQKLSGEPIAAAVQGESFPAMRPGRQSPNMSEPGGYVGPANDCNYADLPMPGLQGPDPDPETLTHDRLWDGTLRLNDKQVNTIQYDKTTGSGYMH